jgi:hypothetical protein
MSGIGRDRAVMLLGQRAHLVGVTSPATIRIALLGQ